MSKSTHFDAPWRARLAAGLAPWLAGVAPLMALAHLILEAGFNFLPVTYTLLIPRLSLTYGQIGTLVLLMTLTGSLTQPLFGWLSDRGDPRLIVVVSVMWGGSLMGLVGFMPTYGALLALVVMAAVGSAAFHPPGAALSSLAETGARGRAMSLFSVGGNLGSALSPLLIGLALSAGGLGATAVLIPLSLGAGLLLARRLRGVTVPRFQATAGEDAGRAGSRAALVAIILVVGARSYFQMGLETYLPEWLRGQGQSLALAGAALTLFMLAVSAGSLFGGWLSDRLGRLPVIGGSLMLMAAGHWVMLRPGGGSQLAAVLLIGLMIGSTIPVTIVLAQEAWPHSVGLASSLVMGIGWLPAGLGAWAVGQIADASTLGDGLASLRIAPLVGLAAAVVYFTLERRASASASATGPR